MKYSFAGIGMVMVGLFAFVIIMIFQFITINNESDYYSLKEAMEASMYESIDIGYFADTGKIKIIQDKFVANFTRRFVSNTIGNSNGYVLEFYDIMEYPPKATVVVKNSTSSLSLSNEDFKVVNNLTGILETREYPMQDDVCEDGYKLSLDETDTIDYYSSLPLKKAKDYVNAYYVMNTSTVLNNISDVKNVYISDIEFVGFLESGRTLNSADLNVNQSNYYHYYYNNSNGWAEVNNNISNSVASCNNDFLSFSAKTINIDGSLDLDIGINKVNNDTRILNNKPIFLNVSFISVDPNFSECTAIAHYKLTWKYSYCEKIS